jgi:outer membrane biosynthesis protein TonB
LQLKTRTSAAPAAPVTSQKARTPAAPATSQKDASKPKVNPFGAAKPVKTAKPAEPTKEKPEEEPKLTEEKSADTPKEPAQKDEKKDEKKKIEPAVVNSRAAAFGGAPDVKRDVRSCIFPTLVTILNILTFFLSTSTSRTIEENDQIEDPPR